MAERDEIVLSFHDAVIKRSDLNLLDGADWLNDRLIGFFFQYLEHKEFMGRNDVAFVSPEVTHCIKMSSDSEVGVFLEPLSLSRKELIILPINDCLEEDSPGGSHWSLLIYHRQSNMFCHYDSCGGTNGHHARAVMHKVRPFLRREVFPNYEEAMCPQQRNSYDCGIHVICMAEYVCRKYLRGSRDEMFSAVSNSCIDGKREWLKHLILSLRR